MSEVKTFFIRPPDCSATIGDISINMNGVARDGYLPCEGQVIDGVDYPELFAVIGTDYGFGSGGTTFNVPDYRGVFLKGFDGTGTIGDYRGDTFQEHNHAMNYNGQLPPGSGGDYWSVGTVVLYSVEYQGTFNYGGNETRPVNRNVMFVIRYV